MEQSLLLRTVFPRQIQRRSSRKSRILVPLGRSPRPEAAFHKRQYLFLMLSKLCGYMVLFQLPQKCLICSFPLKNGMQVHHSLVCKHHTSLWRTTDIWGIFQRRARFSINQQLVAAGATNGLPGDHSLSFKYYSIYPVRSGKWSRILPCGGGRTHQHLRSQPIGRRHQKYNITRTQNRRAYRVWNANSKEWRRSTLVPIPVPPKKGAC